MPLCHVSISQRPGMGKPFAMISSFQTPTTVTAIAWDSCSYTNPNQNALVIGCRDGTVVYHQPTLNASQFIIKKVSTPTTEFLRDLTRKWKAVRKSILLPCLCHSIRMGFTLLHKPKLGISRRAWTSLHNAHLEIPSCSSILVRDSEEHDARLVQVLVVFHRHRPSSSPIEIANDGGVGHSAHDSTGVVVCREQKEIG